MNYGAIVLVEYVNKNDSPMLMCALNPFDGIKLKKYLNFDKIVITKELFHHYVGLFASIHIYKINFKEYQEKLIACLCQHGYQMDFNDVLFLDNFSFYEKSMNVTEKEKIDLRRNAFKNPTINTNFHYIKLVETINDPYLSLLLMSYNQGRITSKSLNKIYENMNADKSHLYIFMVYGEVNRINKIKIIIDFYKKKKIHMDVDNVNNYKYKLLKSRKKISNTHNRMVQYLNKIYPDTIIQRTNTGQYLWNTSINYENKKYKIGIVTNDIYTTEDANYKKTSN